ncbi:hypothetical protein BJV82DRAFT_624687 [Fennellomyces sp. T-0311]|nr:hypothetical protein BJV82DRAFT_624687 [Fennellomyces sp. T-0311]
MVYVIALGAIIVLISMLVNFILFVVNRGIFVDWCIAQSHNLAEETVQQQSSNTTLTIPSDMDYYNCDRLFANQVKWSLLCVITMYIVYIHWMLVFAVFAGTSFFLVPPRAAVPPMEPPLAPESMGPLPPGTIVPPTSVIPPTEFSNLPASKKEKDTIYRNLKPNKKKKQVDPNLLSILGLRMNESGRIIHIADDDCLPRYTDRRPSSASKVHTSSDEEDLR